MVTVGIDPHKKTHTAVLVDEEGRQVGRSLTVKNTPEASAKFVAWAAKHAAGRPIGFVIEDGRGLARCLASALVVAGYPVSWVPVRLMVAARKLLPARGKSDPIDALAVAKAALDPDNAKFLAPHRLDEIGRDLRYLVDARHDKTNERTRLINTLRWRLHELDPSLDPSDLTSLIAARRLAVALTEQPAGVLRDVLIDMCADLERLTGRINKLTAHITTLITELCPTLLARHGVGAITAATIIGELGDPTRVRNGAAFARLAGTAPIPVWTGNTEQHRLDRGGNRKINTAIHIIARTQARSHDPAKQLIAKHHKKGAKHALRVLKRHLTDAIWRDIITDLAHLTRPNPAT